MRKVTFGGACSLDNLFTGPDEAMDWLRWSDDAAKVTAESWKGVDAILMGRKTFEFAMKSGGGGGGASSKFRTYVFSRTLESVPEGAELVREDAAGFVRRMKESGPSAGLGAGDIIVMGGGELGSALIEAGVVDEIGLNIHPLLLGAGTALFHPMERRIELELIEARPIAHGCVLVRYRVLN
ncbi:MAG: dihydrofolate reductase family protein [Sphingosinicella sp.]|uniref:dihydrofolate reductase family protein n=1 Tax=Sphingosinicella sp. TaxID=1917971 RepID=UPI0040378BEA